MSSNPNSIPLEIETDQYPLISVSASSFFMKKSDLNQFVKVWVYHQFEEEDFIEESQKVVFTSTASFSFNQIAVLFSRYLPSFLMVFLISLLTFICLTHQVMTGVYQEVLNDLNHPGIFNADHQLRPMFFEVYDYLDIWFGSALLAVMGGAFPFALKTLICLLMIRNSTILSKKPVLTLLVFFALLSVLLAPKEGLLSFLSIIAVGTSLNYFLFNWGLRTQPYFVKKVR